MINLAELRKEYKDHSLDEKEVHPDPLIQFQSWFDEAVKANCPEPNAMTLATANLEFKPSARIVLLKGIEEGAFVFFTNYNSKKGKDLLWNPYAALCFHWHELERQVRIEGRVEKISAERSAEYFASRPKQSRLGAIASPQSHVISSRKILEEKVASLQKRFEDTEPTMPENWGGYAVLPSSIEFWQGRPSRLHDRILYSQDEGAKWVLSRLAP